ncbi:hypothetical protein [uncultured Psychroserpens sp.]|uniref:tetratricopeptide repeat protein n=1 Tax=uncultured Psychroserpens sp. TaxID=255436 RepID=UPI0026180F9E|nr:hypothetical protein [uncultured Psychroserpens sp.]
MDKDELIALYFTKELSPEAQKEFDHLMASDEEFAKEVAFQKNLKTVITKEEQSNIKAQLQGFESEEKTRVNYKKWFVAAGIVMFLGWFGIMYINNTTPAEKLFAEYFEPYRNTVQPILRGEAQNDIKSKAFQAYETKDYNRALDYFNMLLDEQYDETIAFYKANVLLELNKTENAITILEQNLKTSDSLNDKNSWYLVLAHLQQNNTDKAKRILIKLNDDSNYKREDVKTLLKQLD